MLATALTLAFLGFAVAAVVEPLRRDGAKIMAALRGQSWIATPPLPQRAMTVRISQRYPAVRSMRVQPEWRAAA